MGYADGFLFGFSVFSFRHVAVGHEDRIVDRSAQLDRTDDDACHEGKADPLEIRDSHVDIDGKLDDRNQDERQ